jgi:hypothetical protein
MPIMDTPPVPIGVGGQAALCLSPTHRSLYLRRAAVPKVPRQPCRHPETLRRIYVDYYFVHLSLLPPPLSRNFVIADPVKKEKKRSVEARSGLAGYNVTKIALSQT